MYESASIEFSQNQRKFPQRVRTMMKKIVMDTDSINNYWNPGISLEPVDRLKYFREIYFKILYLKLLVSWDLINIDFLESPRQSKDKYSINQILFHLFSHSKLSQDFSIKFPNIDPNIINTIKSFTKTLV